jgi:cytochrome c553
VIRRAIIGLTALTLAGFLVAASGIVPMKASSGRWTITRWGLEFAKRRSIATHSLGMQAPRLDAPHLVLKGAGHFETTCQYCHGSPALPVTGVAPMADPPPPNLAGRVPRWSDAELFSIVKHGIKWTGMPAWQAQSRDDEVWAMVAFLRRLPGLGPAEYGRLARGDSAAAPHGTGECARCHGADGNGRGVAAFPKLAGQRGEYVRLSLEAFARGSRQSGIMRPVAMRLRAEDIDALAAFYETLETAPSRRANDVSEGQRIAMHGIPEQRVPACSDCHGPGRTQRNPAYPNLAGQYAEYIVLQLELFKENRRGGSRYAVIMQQVAPYLKRNQMEAVARYYASLEP